jgi:peptidoglycan/LPS O-acetylase OafA/YrhL
VAVLFVFTGHLHDLVTHTRSELAFRFAQIGVLIFFVHTSFVLMLSLERSDYRGGAFFGSFYLRRFFRLYPLSIVCVAVAYAFSVAPDLDMPFRHWTLRELAANLTLTTNLTYTDEMVGGLWTLPLEMQMYVVLPVAFLLCRGRPVPFALGLWALSIPIAIAQPHVIGRLTVLAFAPCFLAGVVAWRLSLRVRRSMPGWLWPVVFAVTWAIFLLSSRESVMYFRWAFSLCLGIALPFFAELQFNWLRKLAHVVAKYSYGIYLSHYAIILFVFRMPIADLWQWVVFVPIMVGTPFAMFHLIEQPLIRVGQRLTRRLFRNPASLRAEAATS